jgi:hypothetical protein
MDFIVVNLEFMDCDVTRQTTIPYLGHQKGIVRSLIWHFDIVIYKTSDSSLFGSPKRNFIFVDLAF